MTHGHCKADTDPLDLDRVYAQGVASKYHLNTQSLVDLLDYENYGFTDADLDRKFFLSFPSWGGVLS